MGQSHDTSADIWSLGITVMECITGSHPYGRCKRAHDVMMAITDKPPPRLDPTEFSQHVELCEFVEAWFDS